MKAAFSQVGFVGKKEMLKMCGIAGLILLTQQPGSPDLAPVVESILRQLHHRGPDATGVIPHGAVCVGGCRLSIIDRGVRSNQPLKSPDSNCTVVFNGEIFNYVELGDELRKLGHEFGTTSDTEVILHAYEEWGLESFGRLNGMFALAIFDADTGEIVLARDRFGIKPLYYAKTAEVLAFASEPIPLVSTGFFPVAIDSQVVRDYLRYGVTDCGPRTFFEGVKQLRPGSLLVVRDGAVQLRDWYRLPPAHAESAQRVNLDRAAREFRRRLLESIKIRLRSDVPVALLLSGGLDSSTLAGLLGEVTDDCQLEAFLVSFPGSSLDESRFAELAAESSGVSLNIVPALSVTRDSIDACIRDQGEPMISPSMVAQWLVMKAIGARGIRVAMTGQGADEVLGGYEYFDSYAVAELFATGRIGEAARYLLEPRSARRALRIVAGAMFARLPKKAKLVAWRKRWMRGDSLEEFSEYEQDFAGCKSLRDLIRFHVVRRLPELLRYADRNSMAFSIETREPFLDHTLVEFTLGLPDDAIVGRSGRKRILQLTAQTVVPDAILARREKIGFQTPDTWLKSPEFARAYDELCQRPPPVLERFIDFNKARRLAFGRSSARKEKDLWRIYNLIVWYEEEFRPLLELESKGAAA